MHPLFMLVFLLLNCLSSLYWFVCVFSFFLKALVLSVITYDIVSPTPLWYITLFIYIDTLKFNITKLLSEFKGIHHRHLINSPLDFAFSIVPMVDSVWFCRTSHFWICLEVMFCYTFFMPFFCSQLRTEMFSSSLDNSVGY